jgi:hypothetical protein
MVVAGRPFSINLSGEQLHAFAVLKLHSFEQLKFHFFELLG